MVITFLFNDKGMIQEWHKQYWYIYVNILQAAIKSLNTDKVNLLMNHQCQWHSHWLGVP